MTEPRSDGNTILLDLKDAINTVAYIFQAADVLVFEVSRNIIVLEEHQRGFNLGPVAGMDWAMGELNAAIKKAKDLLDSMT